MMSMNGRCENLMLQTTSTKEWIAIAKVKMPDARSPVLTNQPWAQQVEVLVVMLSVSSH